MKLFIKILSTILFIFMIIKFFSWSFDMFQVQQNDYLSSSQCIKNYTNKGYDRSLIEISGSNCSIK